MKILRVFPRRTKATPTDKNVRINSVPSMFDYDRDADEVHVSVTFTWDLKRSEYLAKQWERVAPVKIGGPATGGKSGEFEPGMYLEHGYTITSRGCPNRCWFCDVHWREGNVRELEIKPGWIIQDDNLLACSDQHIKDVFSMLSKQPHRAELTGGLEAARLKDWHVDELLQLNPKQVFFAYDSKKDYESILNVSEMFKNLGYDPSHNHMLRCYVLIGYPSDTITNAEVRLNSVINMGFMPMAMLYRDNSGEYYTDWRRFQREWANPTILGRKMKQAHK